MGAYDGYPEIKPKTYLKAFWILHDLVLIVPILQTISNLTGILLDPPKLVIRMLSPSIAALILGELTYLTYIVSAVLLLCTVLCLKKEKQAGKPIRFDCIQFSILLVFCILGLLSSRAYVSGALSI